MRTFIRALDMHINHILPALVFFDCFRNLALVVGINRTVGTFHINNMHSRESSDSANQINCRYHGCLHPEFFTEIRKLRACTLSPDPKAVCRIPACGDSCFVNRMILQKLVAFPHHVDKKIRAFTLRQIFSRMSVQNIMRRYALIFYVRMRMIFL